MTPDSLTSIDKLMQSLNWIIILVQSPFTSLIVFGLIMLFVAIRKNRQR